MMVAVVDDVLTPEEPMDVRDGVGVVPVLAFVGVGQVEEDVDELLGVRFSRGSRDDCLCWSGGERL